MAKQVDDGVDKLFQLPLAEFTAARNALAKGAGKNGAAIRELSKPPVAAWAVNQLYWQRRKDYEALIAASEDMRRAHKAVIEGKRGDLREAGRAHEQALDAALKGTIQLVKESGQPVTDATRQQILNTLRALPSDEAPGRLTRVLAPGGFELLAGVKPHLRQGSGGQAAAKGAGKAAPPEKPAKPVKVSKDDKASAREKAAHLRQGYGGQAREAAERAVREADQKARRAEFEAARAVRDADRAAKRVSEMETALEKARQDLEDAERDLAAAEREATAATRARETAERKARDAESAVEAAKSKLRAE